MGEYKVGQWVTLMKHRPNSTYGSSNPIGCVKKIRSIDQNLCYGLGVSMEPEGNWYYKDIRPATNSEIQQAGGQVTGSGVKRKLSEITGKAVVHCSTLEEIRLLAPLLMTLEPYQRNGHSIEKLISGHKDDMCYNIHNNRSFTSGKETLGSYQSQGYTIYQASDFIETGDDKWNQYVLAANQQPVMVTENNWYVGMRVVPGRDWSYSSQGKELGTITGKNSYGDAMVTWDTAGSGFEYRIGRQSKYDLYIHQEQTSNSFNNQIKTTNNAKRTEEGSSKYTGRTVNLQGVTATITTGQRPRGRILSGRIQEATTRSGYLRNKVLTIK